MTQANFSGTSPAFSLPCFTMRLMRPDWGAVPDWIQAVAVLAAAIALWPEMRALRLQVRDARERQARRVWVEAEEGAGIRVTIHNDSSGPLYEVQPILEMPWSGTEVALGEPMLSVPPGRPVKLTHGWPVPVPDQDRAEKFRLRVGLAFRDQNRRVWRLNADGTLKTL